MESFFFNITERRYQISEIFVDDSSHVTRVDISNGVVFLDVLLKDSCIEKFSLKNLDRMVMISVVKHGSMSIYDNIAKKEYQCKNNSLSIYCSSKQDMQLKFEKTSEIFVLFIADFFFKRYLSSREDEPIDFLYNLIQDEISLQHINTQATDALSLYIIDKIINSKTSSTMNSIRCEHSVIEFLIHRLSLCDLIIQDTSTEDLQIAKDAKDILLKSFASSPTIHDLAHLCATNESKLKKVFKKVFKMTIYSYIQKLRLEEANILLKERTMSIGEISKKVGYKHQGHFTKLFFTTYGIYPKDLLKH